MAIGTAFGRLLRFSIGRRDAILELAADRNTLWIGALWVLSAGLARRYDKADLVAEPWQVVMPLVVSWVNATILFAMLWVLLIRRAIDRPRLGTAYRAVLGLFWMTAPMAWLYALPVERWMTPVEAMRANLWLLAIVATWRVLLYARIVAVLIGETFPVGLWITLFFGDAVLLAMMWLSPKPIIAVMGGIEHAPQDLVMLQIGEQMLFLGLATLPIWLIAGPVTALASRPVWSVGSDRDGSAPDRRGRLALVGLALVFWLPILPFTQAEQRLAGTVERHLVAGEIEAAVALMSGRQLDDFPPHFDPRPRLWIDQNEPSIWRVVEVIDRDDAASWVATLYEAKLERELASRLLWTWHAAIWRDAEALDAIPRVLAERPHFADSSFRRMAIEKRTSGGLDPDVDAALERLIASYEIDDPAGQSSDEEEPPSTSQ